MTLIPWLPELVVRSTREIDAIDGIASPLNPRELILNKSLTFSILEVACLSNAKTASVSSIPTPLSVTVICFRPDSNKSISILVPCASIEFSTNSLTTLPIFSMTSPAAILFAMTVSNRLITLICIPYFYFDFFFISSTTSFKIFMAFKGVIFWISKSLSCSMISSYSLTFSSSTRASS